MTDRTHVHTPRTTQGSPVQVAATLVGAVFLLVGVLGFIPGITTNYDGLEAAGHRSHAELLGIFQVSVLHNIVHLLFGAAGIALTRTAPSARGFLVGGGGDLPRALALRAAHRQDVAGQLRPPEHRR
jgi:hypothetical protein